MGLRLWLCCRVDRAEIYDAKGDLLYNMANKALSIGKAFIVEDAKGKDVLTIKKKFSREPPPSPYRLSLTDPLPTRAVTLLIHPSRACVGAHTQSAPS